MAKPSSKYDVKGQVNLNTGALPVMMNSAGTWKTLYPEANLKFDTSIMYTKPAVKTMANMTVPFVGTTDLRYAINEPVGSIYNRTGVNVKIYKHKQNAFPTLPTSLGYTLGLNTGRASNNGFYFWGKDETKDGTLSTNYDTAILRDWKYNEIIIRPRIYGYTAETIEKVENNEEFTPTTIEIQLDELIEHPENYYVSDISYMGALVWDKTKNEWISLAEGFNVFAVYDNNYITGMESVVNQQVSHFLLTKAFNNSSPSRWTASTTANTFKEVIGNLVDNTAPRQLSKTYVYGMGYPDTDFELTPNIDIITNRVSAAPILSTTGTVRTGTVHTYGVLYDNIQSRCWYREEVVYDSLNSQNYFSKLTYSFFYLLKGTFVSQILASFGLYTAPFSGFTPHVDNDQSKALLTPSTLGLGRNMWLGEMNSKGYTSGNWIPMEDLDKYEGYNIDGDSANPDFDPDGGGGGGDTYDLHDDTLPNVHPNSGLGGVQGRWFYTNTPETIGDISELNPNAEPVASWSTAQKVLFLSQTLDKVKDYGKDALVTAISFPFSLTNPNGINMTYRGVPTLNQVTVSTEVFDLVPDHATFGEVTPVNLVTKTFGSPITGYTPILNAGSFDITPYGSDLKFIDFEPYTTIQLHLPFVGWVPLSCSQVMGKTIHVEYHVDLWTATAVAYVLLKNGDISTAIASYPCSVGTQIAIDKTQYANYMSAMLDCMTAVTATAASAGMGNAFGTVAGLADIGASVANGITNACNPHMSQVGSRGSAAEVFSSPLQTAVAIYRPEIIVPENYGHSVGFACEKDATLSSLSGYTVCSGVDTSGINATDSEKARLKAILESGFYA